MIWKGLSKEAGNMWAESCMNWGDKSCWWRKSHSGGENSKCKGPGVGVNLWVWATAQRPGWLARSEPGRGMEGGKDRRQRCQLARLWEPREEGKAMRVWAGSDVIWLIIYKVPSGSVCRRRWELGNQRKGWRCSRSKGRPPLRPGQWYWKWSEIWDFNLEIQFRDEANKNK